MTLAGAAAGAMAAEYWLLAAAASVCAGLVGAFALMRRVSLAGDAISHIALPGLGIAYLLHFDPLLGAAATLAAGALLIWRAGALANVDMETAVGVIFVSALAVGALLTPNTEMLEALFGSTQAMTWAEIGGGLLLAAVMIGALIRYKDPFTVTLFFPDLAASCGLDPARFDLAFLLLFAGAVLLSLHFLGALLAGALIIIPAAIARQLTHGLARFLVASSIASLLALVLGTFAAQALAWAAGPTVVALAALLFVVAVAFGRRRRTASAMRAGRG